MATYEELPPSFKHSAPEGYRYEVIRKNTTTVAIWTVCNREFIYNDGNDSYCIWGFCKTKTTKKGGNTNTYYAPINSNKIGKEVSINDTTPYSAMQLNFSNSLEQLLFA